MEDGWRALRGLLGPGVCFSSFWPDSNNFFLSLPPAVAHEHLKERGLFGLPAAGTNASDYYHQMTLMAGHPAPYGDLLMQTGVRPVHPISTTTSIQWMVSARLGKSESLKNPGKGPGSTELSMSLGDCGAGCKLLGR